MMKLRCIYDEYLFFNELIHDFRNPLSKIFFAKLIAVKEYLPSSLSNLNTRTHRERKIGYDLSITNRSLYKKFTT